MKNTNLVNVHSSCIEDEAVLRIEMRVKGDGCFTVEEFLCPIEAHFELGVNQVAISCIGSAISVRLGADGYGIGIYNNGALLNGLATPDDEE